MLEQYDAMTAFVLPYFNIPVNWTIASTWIVMAVLMVVSFLATRHLKTGDRVSHWQTAMEVMVKGRKASSRCRICRSSARCFCSF